VLGAPTPESLTAAEVASEQGAFGRGF
jgi:hypothetical protein